MVSRNRCPRGAQIAVPDRFSCYGFVLKLLGLWSTSILRNLHIFMPRSGTLCTASSRRAQFCMCLQGRLLCTGIGCSPQNLNLVWLGSQGNNKMSDVYRKLFHPSISKKSRDATFVVTTCCWPTKPLKHWSETAAKSSNRSKFASFGEIVGLSRSLIHKFSIAPHFSC